jgi:hypothetical protein
MLLFWNIKNGSKVPSLYFTKDLKMRKFISVVVASLTLISLSACAGDMVGSDGFKQSDSTTPVTKTATNVEKFKVPGSMGFPEGVIVFDIERDGQILTCTTKQNYNSGVGCIIKKQL